MLRRPARATKAARKPAAKAGKPAARAGKGAARASASAAHPIAARDIMRTDVITIDQSSPLSEVERTLIENRISGAPVTDETGAIVGVISLRDLIERYAEDPDSRPRRGRGWFHLDSDELEEEDVESSEIPEEAEETARDVMTAEVYSVPEDAGLREIARVMHEHHIHRVLVEADGMYVGLLTTMDLLGAIGERPRRARKAKGARR